MFYFDEGTAESVKRILTSAHKHRERIRIFYGDKDTGRDWMEEHDVLGRIGKSTGDKPAPLMIHNARSMGGGAILTANIVKIVSVYSGRVLYQHENYVAPKFGIIPNHNDELPVSVTVQGKWPTEQARFKSHEAATKYIAFMLGERMRKH